eukprot:1136471-Pelagomonas_calceolata.AAC.11
MGPVGCPSRSPAPPLLRWTARAQPGTTPPEALLALSPCKLEGVVAWAAWASRVGTPWSCSCCKRSAEGRAWLVLVLVVPAPDPLGLPLLRAGPGGTAATPACGLAAPSPCLVSCRPWNLSPVACAWGASSLGHKMEAWTCAMLLPIPWSPPISAVGKCCAVWSSVC